MDTDNPSNNIRVSKSLRGMFLTLVVVVAAAILYFSGDPSSTVVSNQVDLVLNEHCVENETMNHDARTAFRQFVRQAQRKVDIDSENYLWSNYSVNYTHELEPDTRPTDQDKLTNTQHVATEKSITSPVSDLNDRVIVLNCKRKVNHFMLSKIEKTGSATLYTVFARFVRFHKLNLAIQTVGWHLALQNERYQKPGWFIGPNRQEKADALIDHAIWHETRIKEIMHEDTLFIVSVREPTSHFKSVVNFFLQSQGFSPEQIIMNYTEVFDVERKHRYNTIKSVFHNMQLAWLGLAWEDRYDMAKAQRVIDESIQRYQIIMLTDLFDASLVLLKRKFCWVHTDILYQSANTQHAAKSKAQQLSNTAKEQLLSKDMNLGDKILYDSLKSKWLSDPIVHTKDFWEEVAYFTQLNKDKTDLCLEVINNLQPYTIPANKWSQELTLDIRLCQQFSRPLGMIHMDMQMYAKTGRMPQQ